MEPTTYQLMARDYHQKWQSALGVIQKQKDEIEALKEELTQERREGYRLRDQIHEREQERA